MCSVHGFPQATRLLQDPQHPDASRCIVKWAIELAEFDIKVVDRARVLKVERKHHDPTATHVPPSPAQIELCGCRINLV